MADEYVPPLGNKVALTFSGDAYTPPPGNKVALEFVQGGFVPGEEQYLFPPGHVATGYGTAELRLQWRPVAPAGWQSSAFGTATLRGMRAYIEPAGWDSSVLTELHRVWNATFQAWPTGIPPGAAGRPTVFNLNQEVRPSGLNAFAGFGAHWVSHGTRRISAAGLGVQTVWGTAQFAGGVRWLDLAGRGIHGSAYGRPIAWFHTRELFPSWFVATLYGRPLLDFNHDVEPVGIEPGEFGQHEVHRPRSLIDLQQLGIPGPAWGEHRVDNFIQYIEPEGFLPAPTEHERFGRPEAWLWTRYLFQLFDVTPSDGGVFGNFNYVDNRNKYPRPEGIAPGQVGTAEVRNNARLIRTPPHQEHTLWGDTLVAYRIRHLLTQGADTSQWGSPVGMIVYNDGRVLAPTGWSSGAVGEPVEVWSNLQWMTHAGGEDSAEFGDAMVAYRVRTVEPYSIAEGRVGLQVVQPWTWYIEPEGIDAARYGVPTLEEHWTIIGPNSVLPPSNQVGDSGRVWNLTPELGVYGSVMTEWGATRIFNQWERYEFQGFASTIFGRHVVRDRRLTIAPGGAHTLAIPLTHQVRNVIPDPPPTRTLGAAGGSSMVQFGSHRVWSNSIRPEGEIHVRWGSPTLQGMSIFPEGITPPYSEETGSQFGTPNLPGQQYVDPAGLYATLFPEPHMWPHYIWAPQGYPYPTGEGDRGHIMDWAVHGWQHPERPVFGAAMVTHLHRTLAVTGWNSLRMIEGGRVSHNPQHVRGEGTRHTRYGFPVINGGGEVNPYGFIHTEWGFPYVVIADYGDRYAYPPGIAGGAFGTTDVSHFHREVSPQGWIEFEVSPPRAPAWPRTSHWVSHEYPPFPAHGADMSEFGDTWVSFRIRHLHPPGWDSMASGYTPGYFNQRMRVSVAGRVSEAGAGDVSAFGAPAVEQSLRAIWPRTMPPPPVPRPRARNVNTIAPAGWESPAFGDIDRWEAGKVKAHGADLAELGRAVLLRVVRPEGFTGDTGEPRIAQPLGPAGIGPGAVSPPAAIARWCGDKAMAVAGTPPGAVGTPAITTE